MGMYLLKASYTTEGVKGLLKSGGSARRASIEELIASLGGKMESFYYAFGDPDVYVIADLPDATTAAAIALAVNSVGAVQVSTTVLLTPSEIDDATKMSVDYRPPGKETRTAARRAR